MKRRVRALPGQPILLVRDEEAAWLTDDEVRQIDLALESIQTPVIYYEVLGIRVPLLVKLNLVSLGVVMLSLASITAAAVVGSNSAVIIGVMTLLVSVLAVPVDQEQEQYRFLRELDDPGMTASWLNVQVAISQNLQNEEQLDLTSEVVWIRQALVKLDKIGRTYRGRQDSYKRPPGHWELRAQVQKRVARIGRMVEHQRSLEKSEVILESWRGCSALVDTDVLWTQEPECLINTEDLR